MLVRACGHCISEQNCCYLLENPDLVTWTSAGASNSCDTQGCTAEALPVHIQVACERSSVPAALRAGNGHLGDAGVAWMVQPKKHSPAAAVGQSINIPALPDFVSGLVLTFGLTSGWMLSCLRFRVPSW